MGAIDYEWNQDVRIAESRGDSGWNQEEEDRRDSDWNQERLCMKRRWRTDEAKNGNEKLKMADTEAKNGRRREVSELDRKK
jgi:hypothetical protein